MRILEKNRAKYWQRDKNVCAFCDQQVLADQLIEKLSSKDWMVLASKYPYLDGNLMLIPRPHITSIDDLSETEWQDFISILKNAKKVLSAVFQTDSFNIALNLGQNSG